MSAHLVFQAPIGAIIAWSDGTPQPPERHIRKRSAWKTNNSSGRLIRKQGNHAACCIYQPANFTLQEGDDGAGGIITIRVRRTFPAGSSLRFTVLERPAVGAVRVFDRPGDGAELVHLAADRRAADDWLSRHGYPRAVLAEVTADEVAADSVEGRAVT